MKKFKLIFIVILLGLIYSCNKLDLFNKELKIEYEITNLSAFGAEDGSISIEVTGGKKPYSYSWYDFSKHIESQTPISEQQNLTHVPGGHYNFKVTDAEGEVVEKLIFIGSYETIISSPYLAAYPGSYWKYSNGDSVYCYGYNKYAYFERADWWGEYIDGKCMPSDSIALPVLKRTFNQTHTRSKPIKGNSYINYDWQFKHEMIIVSEDEGSIYANYVDGREGTYLTKVVAIDQSISVNGVLFDNVILMEEGGGPAGSSFDEMWVYKRYYYAKNIGLIKHERKEGDETEYTLMYEIVEYFINN